MKSYELVHVMTNVILNCNSSTQPTSRSRDIKRPPQPTRSDATTVFVGWTQGAGDDTAKVVASFFGCWSNWMPERNMWSDAGCTYTSLQYQHATAVAVSAGQDIGVAPGEYVHITRGDDKTDTQVTERIDQMLSHKMPKETGDDAAFRRRMKARKQLGADMMTERVIRDINREKQLLAEPEPINVADWEEAIVTELRPYERRRNTNGPPSTSGHHVHGWTPQPTTQQHSQTHTRTPTTAKPGTENQSPQQNTAQNSHKDDTTTQEEQGNTNITTIQPAIRRNGYLHRRHQTQREREGAVKKPTGQRKKVRCLFLMPFIAITALHLLLVPTTHTSGPVLLLPVIRRVRRRYTSPLRHQHGNKRGQTPQSYRMWRPCLLLLYIACFSHTLTALDTGVTSRYYRAVVSIATITGPHNTRYNNNWVLQCGTYTRTPDTEEYTSSDAMAVTCRDPPSRYST